MRTWVLCALATLGSVGAYAQTAQSLFEYDAQGNLRRATTPLGAPTEQSWDSLGHLSETRQPHPTASGTQGVIGYAYDGQGRLKRLTDPRSLVTQFTTDGLGNTTQQVSPDTGTSNYVYDTAGNLKQKTDARGVVTAYQYDALNRLKQITYTKSAVTDETVVLTYDQGVNGVGRLTGMTDASGSTSWAYDPQGHLLSRVQVSAGRTLTVSYTYDTAGRLATLTYPSGHQLAYGYDAAGQVSEIRLDGTVLLTNITYSPFGPVQSWVWGNAQAYARAYDANGRMTSFTLGDATRSLTWDAASRLKVFEDQANGAPTKTTVATAGYDNLDRLTSHVTSTASYGYGYDANGNRTQQTIAGVPYAYTLDAISNRLSNTTGPAPARTYGYDAAGNPSGDTLRSYVWSYSGRLKSVTVSALTTTYAYNGFAQRVSKAAAGSATALYAYDESDHTLGEYDGAGALVAEHVWLGDTPIALTQPQSAPAGGGGTPIVLDNVGSHFSSTGTWSPSTATAGYYGPDYLTHVSAATSSDAATWQAAVSSSGTYAVYARWSSGTNRASNATYRVTHAGGVTDVVVNQQFNGATWVSLGSFTLTAGAGHKVALLGQGNGYLIADAIQLVSLSTPALIADNTDASVSSTGTWGASTSVAGYQGTNYVAHPGATTSPDVFNWPASVASGGSYTVWARWTASPNRASNATYRVTHAGGVSNVVVNQQLNGATWVSLGTFTLTPGAGHKVTLLGQGNGYLIADAIKFEAAATTTPPATATATHYVFADQIDTPRALADATGKVVWRWEGEGFGMSAPNEDPDADAKKVTYNLRFPGQVFDKESGLHFNNARYYDPTTGRFVSSDPIGLDGGLNTFAYAGGNPLSRVDPSGKYWVLVWEVIYETAVIVNRIHTVNKVYGWVKKWVNDPGPQPCPPGAFCGGGGGFAGGGASGSFSCESDCEERKAILFQKCVEDGKFDPLAAQVCMIQLRDICEGIGSTASSSGSNSLRRGSAGGMSRPSNGGASGSW